MTNTDETATLRWTGASDWLVLRNEDRSTAILDCYAGKIHHFTRERSAYHRTWMAIHASEFSFHPEYEEIRRRVEGGRENGAKWLIRELPVLVFQGGDTVLVVANGDPANLRLFLGTMDPETIPDRSVEGLIRRVSPERSSEFCSFITDPGCVPRISARLKRFRSQSPGSRERALIWKTSRSAGGVAQFTELAHRWQLALTAAAVDAGALASL